MRGSTSCASTRASRSGSPSRPIRARETIRAPTKGGRLMAVKLHRCPNIWIKLGGHPCWRVQKALDEAGGEDEGVTRPRPGREKRAAAVGGGRPKAYPARPFDRGARDPQGAEGEERTH